MQAKTFLDVERGLKTIDEAITHEMYGSDAKQRIATTAGALEMIFELRQTLDTIEQVIKFDGSDTPWDNFKRDLVRAPLKITDVA